MKRGFRVEVKGGGEQREIGDRWLVVRGFLLSSSRVFFPKNPFIFLLFLMLWSEGFFFFFCLFLRFLGFSKDKE